LADCHQTAMWATGAALAAILHLDDENSAVIDETPAVVAFLLLNLWFLRGRQFDPVAGLDSLTGQDQGVDIT
jgi:hypothetical protein